MRRKTIRNRTAKDAEIYEGDTIAQPSLVCDLSRKSLMALGKPIHGEVSNVSHMNCEFQNDVSAAQELEREHGESVLTRLIP